MRWPLGPLDLNGDSHRLRLRAAGAAVAVAALVGALVSTTSSASSASARRAGESTRPNILLIVSDDQRWETFSRELMPNVYRELVDKGVLFTRGYVHTPLCCPSRSQILTGLNGQHTGVDGNDVSLLRPTIVEALHDLGYRTMLAGKYLNSWRKCAPRPEFDNWICMGSGRSSYSLVNPTFNVNGHWEDFHGQQDDEKYATDILAKFSSRFIAATPKDVPFFLMYTPTTPHLPADDDRCFDIPVTPFRGPAFDESTDTDGKPLYMAQPALSSETIATIDAYHERMTQAVSCLDRSLGTLFAALGDRADNTLVVYLSDNGWLYGEHRRFGKSVPYEEAVRVPLVIRYPPLVPESSPFALDALVENLDLAPTIAELVGIPWGADGKSLVPLLDRSAETVRDAALLSHCEGISSPCVSRQQLGGDKDDDALRSVVPSYWEVVTEQYAYIEYLTGEKELYDLEGDPACGAVNPACEMTNLAGEDAYADVVAELSARLDALRALPPPETTIVGGPWGTTTTRTVSFTYFTQSRRGRYHCRLTKDGIAGPWTVCNGQRTTLGPLTDGDYVFEVFATDKDGGTDPTPASRAFSVRTTGPPVTILTGPPPDGQPTSPVTFTFSSPVEKPSFECRLGRYGKWVDWEPCSIAAPPRYESLGPGVWSFEVRATDESGATTRPPAQWLFRFDDGGPAMIFDPRPHPYDQWKSGLITFDPEEPLAGPVSCSLDHASEVDCTNGVFTFSGLKEGTHTLIVTATDLSGSSADSLFEWTIDRTPPTVTILSGPPPETEETTATFELQANEKGALYCRLDEPFFHRSKETTCTYDKLALGHHTFTAMASDLAKNFSPVATWEWEVK
jgi:N-acetylglucosamine-6-sulfatase